MTKDKNGNQYPNKKGMTNREYWASKRRNAVKKGVCPSHVDRPAVEGQTRCQECIDNARISRENRRSKGICLSHKDKKAASNSFYCLDCIIAKRARWLRQAGVSEVEIDRAKEAWQFFDGKCQACGSDNPGSKGWTTDHDHKTLKFRGILCSNCNIALGYVRDGVIWLKLLSKYLIRSCNE